MSSYTNFRVELDNKNSSWSIIYDKIDNNSAVLDVGCSSGYFGDILIKDKGCVVDGVEVDTADAAIAKKICRNVYTDSIESDGFPWGDITQKYDYILFIDVLEHLLQPHEVLRKVARLLKPSGKIIFSIPNMANGAVRLQLLQGNFDYEPEGLLDDTHLHYYTGETIRKMVDKSGLVLTSMDFTTFNVPSGIIKEALSRVGLSTSAKFKAHITSNEALVYQYIGEVTKKGKAIDVGSLVAAVKPKLDYDRQLATVQDEVRRQFEEKIAKDIEINRLIDENSHLQREVDRLQKLINTRPMRRISRVIKRTKSRLTKNI